MDFKPFPKIYRLSRDCTVTEKIDGTNAVIFIPPPNEAGQYARKVMAGSRTRWIEPGDDNFGFAKWVDQHWEDLLQLGAGWHYGEWWGQGIQRGYGLSEKRFSLFNPDTRDVPACCGTVPVLYRGTFDTAAISEVVRNLAETGSQAAPGFTRPEGVIVYHHANRTLFKKTIDKDEEYKGNTSG